MYDTKEEAIACPKGDICLVEDLETGLVYNAAFVPELMVYDDNYQNEQAISPLFQKHLEEVSSVIERLMGRGRLVEVGCGKGYFLEMLLARGFDVTGFDPTYQGKNPRVKREYFAPGVIGQANGLILRHVLEHIQDPVRFLEQLKAANGGRGRVYIEVPCFDWICEKRAWFDIFYEHVNYFRLVDFNRIFGEVIESGKLFGGQYLYVIVDLSSLRMPVIDLNDRINFPADWSSRLMEHGKSESTRAVIWGGASKGVIFSLLMARAGNPVSIIIDINPAKQWKYLPGTGLQVKSPERGLADLQNGSTIYVMNSNYIEEIRQMSNNSFRYLKID
jgi:SAM-dependent methyltransferase